MSRSFNAVAATKLVVAIGEGSCIVLALQYSSCSQFGSPPAFFSEVSPAFAFRNELQNIAIQLNEVFS